jgi:subtilisin family serine protease
MPDLTMPRMSLAARAASFLLLTAVFSLNAAENKTVAGSEDRGTPRAASRHYIIQAQHPLRDFERKDLEAVGVEVGRALPGSRYVVRVAEGSSFDAADPRIVSLSSIAPEDKISRAAMRQMRHLSAFVHLDLVFHDDIEFEPARQLIESVGGSLTRPLQTEFQLPRRISAAVPQSAVAALAADDAVYAVRGPMPKTRSDNATEAALSNVTPLYDAPYGLSGAGLAVTVFDKGSAQANHQEFGGRVTSESGTTIEGHPTHVSGTIAASGPTTACPNCRADAKGMAPAVTVHEFDIDANGGDFLTAKQINDPKFKAVSDNNSWGFILGWFQDSEHGNLWVWTENSEFFGGYEDTEAAFDALTRQTGTLLVHSSGNDAGTLGPTSAPFDHLHVDDQGNTDTSNTYCYSANGSGTDCPAPCSAGAAFCEITRHPPNGPFTSIGLTASAKNVLAVGAIDSNKSITTFSSRGPTRDGRIKPELVAKGTSVISTCDATCSDSAMFNKFGTPPTAMYASANGTSMSSPVVTGTSALIAEQFQKSFGTLPGPEMLKTLLIEGADDLDLSPVDFSHSLKGPDYVFGFGMVDARATADIIRADAGSGSRIKAGAVKQGESVQYPFTIAAPGNVRITLGWSDPEVVGLNDPSDKTLINDLDLKVVGPNATFLPYILDPAHPEKAATTGANHTDTTEQVEIAAAPAGQYTIVVTGNAINTASKDDPCSSASSGAPCNSFVVVANTSLGAAVVPCTDVFEPNDTAATAFGFIAAGQTITAKTCTSSDVDFFKMLVTRSGPVTVSVTATDTPLQVTLSGGGGTSSTSIPAGTTGSVTLNAGSGTQQDITATPFTLSITPTAAPGPDASYSFRASFSVNSTPRHAARR